MISQEPNDFRQQELYRQETQIEMDFLEQKKMSNADLISSMRDLAALASLHRSVVRSCLLHLP
jgi:exocyst complex component 4